MKIRINDEVLWKGKKYEIDHENGLAFTPSQIRDAGLCYRNLDRRKLMQPINQLSIKRQGFLTRFIDNFCVKTKDLEDAA